MPLPVGVKPESDTDCTQHTICKLTGISEIVIQRSPPDTEYRRCLFRRDTAVCDISAHCKLRCIAVVYLCFFAAENENILVFRLLHLRIQWNNGLSDIFIHFSPSFLSDGDCQMSIVSLSFGIAPSDNQTLLVHLIGSYSLVIQ